MERNDELKFKLNEDTVKALGISEDSVFDVYYKDGYLYVEAVGDYYDEEADDPEDGVDDESDEIECTGENCDDCGFCCPHCGGCVLDEAEPSEDEE